MRLAPPAAALAALLLPALPGGAAAQDYTFGATAGVSIATLAGDVEGDSQRTGLALNLRIARSLSDHVQLETGLGFHQKGADGIVVPQDGAHLEGDHHSAWLEIPLLVRATLPAWPRVQPSVLAGPSVAFEVACDVETDPLSSYSTPLPCDFEGRSETDWSVVMGVALGVDMGRWHLLAEGRYHLGLTDVTAPGRGLEAHTRAFTIMTGVAVPLGD